jgi:uncharacterized damage-inducible protein DinB
LALWKATYHNTKAQFKRLNDENTDFRITNTMKSAGYIARHLADGAVFITNSFLGTEIPVEGKAVGSGQDFHQDAAEVQTMWEDLYEPVNAAILAMTPEKWSEEIDSFAGHTTRFKGFGYMFYHTAHHSGQLASTLIHGKKI